MTEGPWSIRDAVAGDGEFMADMLVEVVNWSPEWKPRSRGRVLSAPATRHYIAGWPRGTDLGVIAVAGGAPIGTAWLRFFTPDDHGFGYVAPDVPEGYQVTDSSDPQADTMVKVLTAR
jgi:hypothetical protein